MLLHAIALVSCALLAAGCDSVGDEARREYFKALELNKVGGPLEEQLAHVDRAVRLNPTAASYLEHRAGLLLGFDRFDEARADYDRAIELADRPYLRFERAEVLCALGEYRAAVSDLDIAIAAQPDNIQFYPRRALARLALGWVREARADVDHALVRPRAGPRPRLANAAVLMTERKPAEAIAELGPLIEQSSYSHSGLPRTLRLLAHTAMDHRELARSEFDKARLNAATQIPSLGYHYWLVRRGCENAFVVTQAGELVEKALSVVAPEQRTSQAPGRT